MTPAAHSAPAAGSISSVARRMKIVQLVNSLDVGGTERLVVDLASALQSRGHDVSVVCLRGAGALAEPLQSAGIGVLALEKPEGPNVSTLWRLTGYLRRLRVDVVHTHNPLVHHYGVVAGRLAGVSAVVNTIHGIGNLSAEPGLKEMLYSGMCRASSRVVAVCPMAYRAFCRGRVIPVAKLVAINNGIPLENFLGVEAGPPSPNFTFGIVGRLVPVKDHSSLLTAFRLVQEAAPHCRLEILGDGPLRADLQRRAAEQGIAAKVLFHGFSSRVADVMRRWHVSVLCSLSEGLPLGVLESMAAGLPIVGADVGGLRDLVEGGQCGWVCPSSDSDALAKAMLRAVETAPAVLREMGASGRAHVVEHYSLSRMTEEYERLFTELLAG